jgi:hypothetical protein
MTRINGLPETLTTLPRVLAAGQLLADQLADPGMGLDPSLVSQLGSRSFNQRAERQYIRTIGDISIFRMQRRV